MKKLFFLLTVIIFSGTTIIYGQTDRKNLSNDLVNKDTAGIVINRTLFGSYLFNNENLTFEPSLNIRATKDYQIGVGDEILISIWGNSQQVYQLTVNSNGQVNIPGIGPIYVAGLEFFIASKKIMTRLKKTYVDMLGENPGTFASVDLGKLHPIKVNIVGEIIAPGTYTLPATATVFNALYLSGGPNSIGSFRNIKLIRNKKEYCTIDIYKFLLDGNQSENVILRDNDIIFVPLVEKTVTMAGEFKRNARFELKEGETLNDLIYFSGGYTAESYLLRLKVYRKTQQGMRIEDVLFDNIGVTSLMDEDSVVSEKILHEFRNRVKIFGAVFRPGEFQMEKNMGLLDLILKADSLYPDAYLKKGVIFREKPDLTKKIIDFDVSEVMSGEINILLNPNDSVLIKSQFELKEDPYILSAGMVLSPGKYKYYDGMTLGDVIFLSDGLKEGADTNSIQVGRRLTNKKTATLNDTLLHVYTFSLPRNLLANNQASAFPLEPFDQINVRQAPGFRKEGSAKILGEVINPGPYAITTINMRISDLVAASGGLAPSSYPLGAVFRRAGEGIVAIDLRKILSNPGSNQDLLLRPGDILSVPKIRRTVKICGEIQNPFSQPFIAGRRTKFYINNAGGFTDNADRKYVYVLYPNGSSGNTKRFLFFKIYPKVTPGSKVFVPAKK